MNRKILNKKYRVKRTLLFHGFGKGGWVFFSSEIRN